MSNWRLFLIRLSRDDPGKGPMRRTLYPADVSLEEAFGFAGEQYGERIGWIQPGCPWDAPPLWRHPSRGEAKP